MGRATVVDVLHRHEVELRRRGVISLALFGSTARDAAHAGSDVDLLVELAPRIGIFEPVDLRDYLEAVLESKVDLVPKGALKPRLREAVLAEAETVIAE